MGFVDVTDLSYKLPGGRVLFSGVSFRVRNEQHVALVGANGTGKTTLLRVLAGDDTPLAGGVSVTGEPGFMRQFIGAIDDDTTVRDLLLSLEAAPIRGAAEALAAAEEAVRLPHGRAADDRYAHALAAWDECGGYDAEVRWDICTTRALGLGFDASGGRLVRTLSGGEQKKLALEALLRSEAGVLLLDEPDNFLDIAGKRALEESIAASDKTILFVSHDREFLSRAASRVVTLEGHGAWTHEGSFATYHESRLARLQRLDERHRRHTEEHERLKAIVKELKRRAAISDLFAAKAKAAESRLRHFEESSPPPERPRDQRITMRLGGGRTANRALAVRALSVSGIFEPFEAEVLFGERVGVIGPNGTGKSHFLRLLAGEAIPHGGEFVLGSRVVPGYFSQTNDNPELYGSRVREVFARHGLDKGGAMPRLRRYELEDCYDQHFDTLSGGQQARLQVLMLEVVGSTMLLLDEPTDNLDIASAEALEDALGDYEGTVLVVTHDRWLMRTLDRFLVFGEEGSVSERLTPP